MRARETHDVIQSSLAVAADAVTVWLAAMFATWIRFDSGWFAVPFGRDPFLYKKYALGGLVAVLVNYIVMRRLKAYRRPQRGAFSDTLPKIVRASGLNMITLLVLMSIAKNFVEYSNGVALLLFPVLCLLFPLQRGLLFRLELRAARKAPPLRSVLIIGADAAATRLLNTFSRDPRLRIKVAGLLTVEGVAPESDIPAEHILGKESELEDLTQSMDDVTQVIIADGSALPAKRVEEIVQFCEKRMIRFNMVPDLFRMLTSSMAVETVEDIPLLGVSRWPLENARNRALKRLEDIVGATLGLILSGPVILFFGLLHKLRSPGPIFYAQTRCGYAGKPFTIYKLRTMKVDAEAETGPVFAVPDDPRRTPLGAWMRAHNIDELPQLWNVLKGDMSLVGPRPERPVFVEQFREEISRYMWRHACRPGITGWAQINGFRGDTSIEGRLRCDLFYLEHWSLALDLKIMLRTVFAMRNAY